LPLDPLHEPLEILSDSRRATVEAMIGATVTSNGRFDVGLFQVIHGTALARVKHHKRMKASIII